jgi:N-acetylglucosaminyldiphosphoundecaprenol N-acetyl-beta-D-mannosaminyltransferase
VTTTSTATLEKRQRQTTTATASTPEELFNLQPAAVRAVAPPARCDVLGVQVSAVNMPMAVAQIGDWIERGGNYTYVCITGVHGVMESQRNPQLKRIHNAAGMVTPDGMPMVWINRLNGNSHVDRVYGPDLMLEVCKASPENGYKHFFYGGAPGVAEKLAVKLQERFPGLEVVGTYTPPFRSLTDEEDQEVVRMINRSGADIVWVGLSTPKQELWMADHVGWVQAPVMIGVGAAFDFHAGLKSQAPRWMQRSGMEWFYRMVTEPRRLWKRYLTNNPLFCWYFLLQRLGFRDFSPKAPSHSQQRMQPDLSLSTEGAE